MWYKEFPLIKFSLLLFAVACVDITFSQVGSGVVDKNIYRNSKVYISIDVPEKGVATEDKEIFIDPVDGSFAYVIIDNHSNRFPVDEITLISYKKVSGKYEKIKQENFSIDSSFYYTYVKYNFTVPGEYAFDVYDKNHLFINSAFVTATSQKNDLGSEKKDDSLYRNAKVYCALEPPVNGKSKDVNSIMIDVANGSFAYIIADNAPDNFSVNKIELKSYLKVDGKWKSLKNEVFDISTDYKYTYIKYIFTKEGDYAFDLYDINNKFIGTSYIHASYK